MLLADKATVEQGHCQCAGRFPAWRNTPPLKRARVMGNLKVLLEQHADELCAADHRRARQGAGRRAWASCSAASKTSSTPATHPSCSRASTARTSALPSTRWSEFQALGVTAGITPFNFPAMVPLWMWPMAVACGNTFILKPSERDPSSHPAHRRTGAAKPACRRACSTWSTATRRPWTRC